VIGWECVVCDRVGVCSVIIRGWMPVPFSPWLFIIWCVCAYARASEGGKERERARERQRETARDWCVCVICMIGCGCVCVICMIGCGCVCVICMLGCGCVV